VPWEDREEREYFRLEDLRHLCGRHGYALRLKGKMKEGFKKLKSRKQAIEKKIAFQAE
jgi:hypothetical protein